MAEIEFSRTYGSVWRRGDALVWQNDGGVHCLVMVDEVRRGPCGGFRGPGRMASICAPSVQGVNAALASLDLGPLTVRRRDIKVAA